MSKIASFEEACKALNIKPTVPDFSAVPEIHRKALEAHYKLVIIAEAVNEGWKPDWNNTDQPKYFPWFDVEASEEQTSGSGLSFNDYYFDLSTTIVGSRLSFQSRELAKYVGTQFKDLYEDYFLIK